MWPWSTPTGRMRRRKNSRWGRWWRFRLCRRSTPPDRLLAVAGQGDLAQGYGAGGHVHQDRAFQIAGHTDADRVGAQLAGPPPEWGHVLGSGAGVGGNHADHALLQRHGWVIAQAPDVALVVDGYGGDAVASGFLDGHAHCPLSHHEPEPPVAVDYRGAGGLFFDSERGARHDVAGVDAVGVGGNLDHAVGIVSRQVGLHEVGRHHFRLRLGGTLGLVNVVGGFMKVIGREYRHGVTSFGLLEARSGKRP